LILPGHSAAFRIALNNFACAFNVQNVNILPQR
jgi:hypothetical protein